jgi:hypothetical protein
MNSREQRRWDAHVAGAYDKWVTSGPPEWEEEEELDEDGEPLAPYGRDSWGEPYTYEDMKSAHEDDEYHRMINDRLTGER